MELEKVKVSQLPQVESLEQNDRALILRPGNSEDDIPFDATAPLGSLLNLVQQLQQIVSEQSTTIATLTQKVEGFQGSLQTLIPVDTENIADGAVTGGKIADSTVTSQNIDWATLYPVNSLFFTATNIHPSTFMPGTQWELYAQGRTIVGYDNSDSDFNAGGKTGGEKTHTLTETEMPSHTHNLKLGEGSISGNTINYPGSSSTYYSYNNIVQKTGGSEAHNNMPPYIVVYIWRRIA